MKTLLLTAKFIAIKEKTKHIELEHLQAAIECLEKIDKKNSNEIEKICHVKKSQNSYFFLVLKYKNSITQEVLDCVKNAPVHPFSPDVFNIVETLTARNSTNDLNAFSHAFKVFSPLENSEEASARSTSRRREQLSKFERLKSNLSNDVFGQETAIEALVDGLVQSDWQEAGNKPKGIFLFLGSPATGKTFLAERFSYHLGQDYKFKLFDMTQYTNSNEAFGLVGAKKSYDDSEPGRLTQFVSDHPKSIIVLDEFEKAHSQVLLSLLQLFSTGYLTDEHTQKTIDFRNVIVILTSNLGTSFYNNESFLSQLDAHPHQVKKTLISHLSKETKIERDRKIKAIPGELLSRLSQGSIVFFKKLPFDQLSNIASAQVQKDITLFSQQYDLSFSTILPEVNQLLLLHFAPTFDIRDIKASISHLIIDPVTDFLRNNPTCPAEGITVQLDSNAHDFLTTNTEIKHPKQLSLKHQTLHFDVNCQESKGQLTLTISNPILTHIAFSEDMEVTGGLTVDFPSITFSDIAGHSYIKSRLSEAANLLKQTSEIEAHGVAIPSGMLLYGPPGTGKTMLAKAFANEANLPFIACVGTDLLSEAFITSVFKRARKYAPSILFIDEIDALPSRGSMGPRADALINRLLTEIDGFSTSGDEVFIIGATNLRDKLDPALIRSGRLDLHLEVPSPDRMAREWLLTKQIEHPLYDDDLDVSELLTPTTGLTGADLSKIHREAVLTAMRNKVEKITLCILIEEINILKYGAKTSNSSDQQYLREVAIHEAGHAVISKILMPNRKIDCVSIISREQTLGMVSYAAGQKLKQNKEYWESLTCVALAGRAAQVKESGDNGIDTGASSDLTQASHYAWVAITEFGMHSSLYNLNIRYLEQKTNTPLFSKKIEDALHQWIITATEKTDKLVEEHWQKITLVANALIEDETINDAKLSLLLT
ncbi:AAA family ATPase [Marinomonas algarum]|uniref:AAA family ATPase n=1 Tax=Marinomonas algarum TaxID=2883105 RepID=A0A9X1IQ98_9GAMM|nr:AAA family ATPase [Marinomonas algarum]MCB5161948.1 AAA family ATPase [Marinomonas algarum]